MVIQLSQFFNCLNPYYVGRWFLLILSCFIYSTTFQGLNPYYVGRWFLLKRGTGFPSQMVTRLNPYYVGRWFLLKMKNTLIKVLISLNPYYVGRWFLLGYNWKLCEHYLNQVLILIMLEGGFCFPYDAWSYESYYKS